MDAPPAMTIPFKNRRRCNAADSESAMSVLPGFFWPRKASGLTDFLSQAGEPTASTRSNPDQPSSAADDIAYGDDAAGGRTAVAGWMARMEVMNLFGRREAALKRICRHDRLR